MRLRLRGHIARRGTKYNRVMRPTCNWQLRSRGLKLGVRTCVMGVVNVTPDSFSDGGAFLDPQRAVAHALQLMEEGADIVDIGGESTRPGTHVLGDLAGGVPAVTADEELRRVLPVIEGILRERPDAIVSTDTYKSSVAKKAVEAGAEIVNDVSAFQWDPSMAKACAELQCGVVLMHTRGRPTEWRTLPVDPDVAMTVKHDLANRVQIALDSGNKRDRIVVDPGFGFGKNAEENYALLANLPVLQDLRFPILAGTSRKSFVGSAVGQRLGGDRTAPSERRYGSLAAMVASILNGAHIVRVHEVRPAVEAAAVADAVLSAMS